MKRLTFDTFFSIIALIFLSGGIMPILSGSNSASNSENANSGNLVAQVIFSLIYLVTFALITKRWNLFKKAIAKNIFLVILLLVCLISVSWSVHLSITLRRVISLFGSSLFGYYLGTRYSLNDLLLLINRTLITICVLSLLVIFLLPSEGLMSASTDDGKYVGAWKGIYYHKSILGEVLALLILISYVLYFQTKKFKYLLQIPFALIFIFFSQSTSAVFITVIIITFGYLLRFVKNGFTLVMAFATLITPLFLIRVEDVLISSGKDLTLTGRTLIWRAVWDAIQRKPYLGYGYGAFWAGAHSDAAEVWRKVKWEAPHAHNGFLDVVLNIGYLGLAIYLILFISKYLEYIKNYAFKNNTTYLWGVLFFSLILIYNFVESNILEQTSIYWTVFIATIVSYSLTLYTTKIFIVHETTEEDSDMHLHAKTT